MSASITIDEAQAKLRELIHRLAPGEEVIITENQEPVAKLVSQSPKPRPRPGLHRLPAWARASSPSSRTMTNT